MISDIAKKERLRTVGTKNIELKSYTKFFINNTVLLHNHLFFEFNITLNGSFINNINDKKITFLKGYCSILRPNDYHCFEKTEKNDSYKYQDVYISVEKMKKCCEILSPTLYNSILNHDEPIYFNLNIKDYEQIIETLSVFNNPFDFSSEHLEAIHVSVVIQVLTAYLKFLNDKSKANFPAWINNLLQKMENIDFLIKPEKHIAGEIGYTTAHFSREFKKHMNMPFIKYLNTRKANIAAELLVKSNMQIIEISQYLGYSSLSPFNKNFKDLFGCSPSQYRKTFKIQ